MQPLGVFQCTPKLNTTGNTTSSSSRLPSPTAASRAEAACGNSRADPLYDSYLSLQSHSHCSRDNTTSYSLFPSRQIHLRRRKENSSGRWLEWRLPCVLLGQHRIKALQLGDRLGKPLSVRGPYRRSPLEASSPLPFDLVEYRLDLLSKGRDIKQAPL